MRKEKLLALMCTAALVGTMSVGCSNSDSDSTTTAAEAASTETAAEAADTVTVKVTAVDGNTVTATKGEIKEASGGGDKPADKADGDSGETPPNKPDGDGGESQADKPDGASGGSSFEESDETITFTLTDDTTVTLEYLQGSGEGTLSDIVVGAVLEVTLDENNNATVVIVKNLNAGGSDFGGSSEVTNGTAANTIDQADTVNGETYTSSGDDENALRVDGVAATLEGITVNKTGGDSSNTENGDFYGQNAGLLALNGATVTIKNATINTDAVNGNGVFSYGEGTTVDISDSTITTSQNNSGGIQTTGGGTTNALNLHVETQGNSSAAIRSDRGGGTVTVNGGSFVTNGTGSPAIYCTADISVTAAQLTANHSEGVVVEGKNSVSIKDCTVISDMDNTYNGDEDENIHAIMIYQSMSGDADVGKSSFSAEGGSIQAKTGDMFYITNTSCEVSLTGVSFVMANDTFMRIEGNSSERGWGTEGANGGDVTLTTENQSISGNILVDDISTLNYTMKSGTSLSGAINPEKSSGTVAVVMESGSTWNLTQDSYLTSFDGDTSQINANGYHVYVNGEAIV
jgi:hypothetical protein